MKMKPSHFNLFEPVYIPTLDDLAELDDVLRDMPVIEMRERMDNEEAE
jgi:hypothetical protein